MCRLQVVEIAEIVWDIFVSSLVPVRIQGSNVSLRDDFQFNSKLTMSQSALQLIVLQKEPCGRQRDKCVASRLLAPAGGKRLAPAGGKGFNKNMSLYSKGDP